MSRTERVDPAELVGLLGFAAIAGLNHSTARTLRYRGLLPSPLWIVDGRFPLWTREQVEEWKMGRSQ